MWIKNKKPDNRQLVEKYWNMQSNAFNLKYARFVLGVDCMQISGKTDAMAGVKNQELKGPDSVLCINKVFIV